MCINCPYALNKCPVSMYNKHKRFGVPPPKWYQQFEVAKIQAILELTGEKMKTPACVQITSTQKTLKQQRLLIATLFGREKYYVLKPFAESLSRLELPIPTDFCIVTDRDARRVNHTLQLWIYGKLKWLPDIRNKFNRVQIVYMDTYPSDSFMDRITRGRNMVVDYARKHDHDMILFIDNDILVPTNTVTELMKVDAEIVGALVKCRRDDREGWYNIYIKQPNGTYLRKQDFTPGEILEVDATGCDCLLIHKCVFSKLKFQWRPEIPEAEDFGYCRRAKLMGYRVKVHTGVITKHVELKDITVRGKYLSE